MLEESDQIINLHKITLPEIIQPPRSQFIDPEKDVTSSQWRERMAMINHNMAEAQELLPLINPATSTRRIELADSLANLKIVSPTRFGALKIPADVINQLFAEAKRYADQYNIGQFLSIADSLITIAPDRCRELFSDRNLIEKIGNLLTGSGETTSVKAQYVLFLKQISPQLLTMLSTHSLPDFPAALDIVVATSANTDANSSESFMNFKLQKMADYRMAAAYDIKPALTQPFIDRVRVIMASQVAVQLETLKHAMIITADKVEIGEQGIVITNNINQPEKNTATMPILKMR